MHDELTPRQVADELGVTVRTVQRWIAEGRLPSTRVGARTRVSRSSLAAVSGAAAVAMPIRSLLVANRGEIAVRIARSARAMGIRAVGIHAVDERPPRGMDETHEVASYLDGDQLIAVARRAGADAVHPGYGFLAEHSGFATAVTAAGLTWVGPPPGAIAAMGDKAAARRRAGELGVPIVPGYDGDANDDATLMREAERIGYPLLVKPSAGGGGKGMRVVTNASELPEALAGARREAQRSFADERLILERYLAGSRHVEIQVLCGADGVGVHLGERDCSSQRRNQKIVEEAPGPSVTPDLRARMGESALVIARAAGYVGAGTVEMLLTDAGEHFFLEMNTRLQVEHPVTEAVTGRDLVADQLRIAGAATLAEMGLRSSPRLDGHAIEARLYAEDPESGFLPATGSVALLRWPERARVDTGVEEGDTVSDRYDPMLAKLIVHGASRAAALASLTEALDATTILGVRTNLRFLRWLAAQPVMREGEMRTDTIAGLELPPRPIPGDHHWRAAALALESTDSRAWAGGWRLNAPPVRRIRHDGADRSVTLVEGGEVAAGPAAVRDGSVAHVAVEGQSLDFALAPPPSVEESARHATAAAGEGASILLAPMPGRVIAVRVAEGASVQAHEAVVVIEAMKMEHAVLAPSDGVLASLHVREGQQVQRGDLIGEVAPSQSARG